MDDKKILVFYIGVGNMDSFDIPEYVGRIRNNFFTEEFLKNANIEVMLIPTRENHSKVECINPKYITDQNLIAEHENKLKECYAALNNFIAEIQTAANERRGGIQET